jgi:hypothetical protein
MENLNEIKGDGSWEVDLQGEVLFESMRPVFPRASLRKEIHATIRRGFQELPQIRWASYLVIFSPGQDPEEIRCQVDVETDGQLSAFAVGYGPEAHLAFQDAGERMQWLKKDSPKRMSV